MTLNGFWSYVHADDEAEGGRIAQLARDIVSQFEMMTGETVELFLDRDSLEWGARWQDRIEGALATVAFFVPVLTPRYFASVACRNELNSFARTATDLGVRELLLPLLYAEVPGADADEPDDELVALARSFQWVDWRDHRFANRDDGVYRRAVYSLAERLAAANRDAEMPGTAQTALDLADREGEEGLLEVMATFEDAVPHIAEVTGAINEEIVKIGEITQIMGGRMNAPGPGTNTFAFRLRITRELAAELKAPADRVGELGEEFARTLHDMDRGVRVIVMRAPQEPEHRKEFLSFFGNIRGLADAAETGLGALMQMGESAAHLEDMSREIRPVIREMRRGLTLVAEGREVIRQWTALIDSTEMPDVEPAEAGEESTEEPAA
ncbi:toll/interleukin-1 receptor domain-containing protein [Microterricola pindariensis]|uniref:TIR domain-containing protein n=1 Tax=Microterricola pindariensis TaxID=478010 RepID=A0ABX5AS19_9MICO|nr:toll/interleukin-1 receptor domain-containing protein [Microterricola pindariensis]PPL14953.1 hypothetical protein GY24_15185 [Microterricola pindariensis]